MAGIFEDKHDTEYDYRGLGDDPKDKRLYEIAASFGNWDRQTRKIMRRIDRQGEREKNRYERTGSTRTGLQRLLDSTIGKVDEGADSYLDERMYDPEEDYAYEGTAGYIKDNGSMLDKLRLFLNGGQGY